MNTWAEKNSIRLETSQVRFWSTQSQARPGFLVRTNKNELEGLLVEKGITGWPKLT